MICRRAWTRHDEAVLCTAVAARRSADDIAADIDRTPAAVRMRMNKLRLRIHPKLPPAHVDAVAELYAVGMPVKKIALRLGIRPAQVTHVIRDHGLVNARSYCVGGDLPLDDEIQRLSAEGLRASEIARRVGRSPVRVRGRLVTLARREAIAEAEFSLSSPGRMFAGRHKQEHA